jgi:GTP cyclohydrolase II
MRVKNLDENSISLHRARAAHELVLQQPMAISDGKRVLGGAAPAEFIDEKQWEILRLQKPLLLISPARARILAIGNAVALDVSALSLKEVWSLVAGDAKAALIQAPLVAAPSFAPQLISLAKQGGILPALLWTPDAMPDAYALPLEALMALPQTGMLRGETVMLPIDGAENATLTSFRTQYGAGVHLALIIGTPDAAKQPLVRVHSSCVTGDMLGSLRCDCGGQLQLALSKMKGETTGILLYLYQEGRDIGITSKLRAYALQERGMDTFAANQQLGFEEDERDFSIASTILKTLGYTHVRLLTNNPDKIEQFEKAGIEVTERIPLITGNNAHSHHYIDAKKKKRGHLF